MVKKLLLNLTLQRYCNVILKIKLQALKPDVTKTGEFVRFRGKTQHSTLHSSQSVS